MEEQHIILRCQAGDAAAFEQIIRSYYDRVYYVAYAWVNNAASAEDITQETFVCLYLSVERLKNPHAFSSWLFSVTRNIAKEWLRKSRTESALLGKISTESRLMEQDEPADYRSPHLAAITSEMTGQIRDALDHLTPEMREIVLLHYAEEMSQTEIGRQLGLPPYTVNRRLDKAYEQLRGIMSGNELKGLACLKPQSSSITTILALVATVSTMSATGRTALYSLVSDIIVSASQTNHAIPPKETKAQSITDTSLKQSQILPNGKVVLGTFLKTGLGKIILSCSILSLLIFAARTLTQNKYKKTADKQLTSASRNDPDSKRHNGAGDSIRTKKGDKLTGISSVREFGAGSFSSKDNTSKTSQSDVLINSTQDKSISPVEVTRFSGQVFSSAINNKPLGNATLSIFPREKNSSNSSEDGIHVITNQNGKFDTVLPFEAPLKIKVRDSKNKNYYHALSQDDIFLVPKQEGKTLTTKLFVTPGTLVSGIITDMHTSEPIVDVKVSIIYKSDQLKEAYTDSNGFFQMEGIFRDKPFFNIEKNGFLINLNDFNSFRKFVDHNGITLSFYGKNDYATPYEIWDSKALTQSQDMSMVKSVTYTGEIYNSNMQPVDSGTILCFQDRQNTHSYIKPLTRHFTFNLYPNLKHTFLIESDGYSVKQFNFESGNHNSLNNKIILLDEAIVQGSINGIKTTSTLKESVNLSLLNLGKNGKYENSERLNKHIKITFKNNHFFMMRVPEGNYKIVASSEGYQPIISEPFILKSAQKKSDIQFHFENAATITGIAEMDSSSDKLIAEHLKENEYYINYQEFGSDTVQSIQLKGSNFLINSLKKETTYTLEISQYKKSIFNGMQFGSNSTNIKLKIPPVQIQSKNYYIGVLEDAISKEPITKADRLSRRSLQEQKNLKPNEFILRSAGSIPISAEGYPLQYVQIDVSKHKFGERISVPLFFNFNITGRVLDDKDGLPVKNALVSFEATSGSRSNYSNDIAITDTYGKFTIRNNNKSTILKIDPEPPYLDSTFTIKMVGDPETDIGDFRLNKKTE